MKTKFLGLLMVVVYLLAGCYTPATFETAPTAQSLPDTPLPAPPTSAPTDTPLPAPPTSAPTDTPLPASPTSVPTDTPLPASPTSVPTTSAIDATQTAVPYATQVPKSLVEYAITLTGIVESGRAALRRDVPLLIAAGIIPLREFDPDLLGGIEIPTTQDPAAACGGAQTPHPTLVADAALMRTLHEQLSAIKPPDQVVDWVHKPLLNAVEQWGNALDKVNASCATTKTTERERLRVEARLELVEGFANFVVASTAASQIYIWTGLIDATETITGKEMFGEDVAGDSPCEKPDIYHPDAQLAGAALANADLSNCILTNANLRGADLASAMLDNASLVGADLRDASLRSAMLDGANLTGARLNGADLRSAMLDGAILAGADLSDADLRSAMLSGAKLEGVLWNNTVCPDGTNSDTNGLNACPAE